MKPILVIKLKSRLSQQELTEMNEKLKNRIGGDVFTLILSDCEHNSVQLLTGKKTKFKKQIINKILSL